MTKRIYDLIFVIIFLILTAPLLVIVSIIIKLTSKGPIIYKAKRVGKGGEVFTLYKFRTMHVDSGDIKVTTLKNDQRIYPFGKFLRKTKIDEFPQLINILLGQMSVVGPRPEDVSIAEKIYIGEFTRIYNVKPGLTSPASLFDYTHGERYTDEKTYIKDFLPKKLQLELYYVQYNNFAYDVSLTFRTAITIFLTVMGKTNFDYPREYLSLNSGNFEPKDISIGM